jgi:hypothetical protein
VRRRKPSVADFVRGRLSTHSDRSLNEALNDREGFGSLLREICRFNRTWRSGYNTSSIKSAFYRILKKRLRLKRLRPDLRGDKHIVVTQRLPRVAKSPMKSKELLAQVRQIKQDNIGLKLQIKQLKAEKEQLRSKLVRLGLSASRD